MTIRELKVQDAKIFLSLMHQLDNESEFMLYEPNERKTSVFQMRKRIESSNSTGGVILGAFLGEQIVGFISLDRGIANRTRHSGYIVIGVTQKASGKGIGTKLLENLESWSIEHQIRKLELTVMTHNENAHYLYLKSGFSDEGIKKMSIQINGEFFDEYYMGKTL